MRVLPFIATLFLAAVTFVVAAPSTSSSGGSVQSVTSVINDATNNMSSLSKQFTAAANQSSVDTTAVSKYVAELTAITRTTTGQLNVLADADLADADLTDLCGAISALLCLVIEILQAILCLVTSGSLGALKALICELLDVLCELLHCLSPFLVGTLQALLAAVLTLVFNLLAYVLKLVNGN